MTTWPMATLGSGCSGWDKNHVILVIFEPPSKQSNAIFLAKFSTKYSELLLWVIQERPGLFVSRNKIKTVRRTCQVVRFGRDALTITPISRMVPDSEWDNYWCLCVFNTYMYAIWSTVQTPSYTAHIDQAQLVLSSVVFSRKRYKARLLFHQLKETHK